MLKRVSPKEAHELITSEGYALIDVRTVVEFEAGHPKGAFNVPVVFIESGGRVANASFVDIVEKHFAKDARIILSCQAGRRSLDAAALLEARGYAQLVDQRAGWGGTKDAFGGVSERGWEDAGLPSETGDGGDRS